MWSPNSSTEVPRESWFWDLLGRWVHVGRRATFMVAEGRLSGGWGAKPPTDTSGGAGAAATRKKQGIWGAARLPNGSKTRKILKLIKSRKLNIAKVFLLPGVGVTLG